MFFNNLTARNLNRIEPKFLVNSQMYLQKWQHCDIPVACTRTPVCNICTVSHLFIPRLEPHTYKRAKTKLILVLLKKIQ